MNEQTMSNPFIKVLAVLVSLFLLALIANYSVTVYQKVASTQKEKDTITISATGEIDAKPDLATASISVMTEGKDPKTVQDQNTAKINRVTDFIKKIGVKDEDVTTQNYNLYPKYDYTDGEQRVIGYTLYQTVVLKLRDLGKVGEVMKGVVENGANTIDSLIFSIDDPNTLKQEARKKALENAKAKAQELAKVAGLSLGKVKNFSESDIFYPTPMPYALDSRAVGMGSSGEGVAASPDIQPGSTKVTASVSVTFELK